MKRILLCAWAAAAAVAALPISAAADWRDEANARIEQYRKGDLSIRVVDQQGRPVSDATVLVNQTRHAFGFGTAVNEAYFVSTSDPDNAIYREKIRTLFNKAVLENGHKWLRWENPTQRNQAITTTQWLLNQGLEVRGHTMTWQRWDRIPTDVYDNRTDLNYINNRVLNHINAIGSHQYVGGQITEWDVVNELWSEHVLTDLLSPSTAPEKSPVLVEWFNAARAAAPNAQLYVNDYSILASGGRTNTNHQNAYFELVKYLKEQGAPIGGIGMQSHFGSANARTQPEQLLQILDRFAQFDLPIQITEFDMSGSGWTQQEMADYMRDFLTATFSHPSVEGFLMWGFWDGKHHASSAPLFDMDWNLKPSGQVFMDLVFGEWWTQLEGITDPAGVFDTRGFLGLYDITVMVDGVSQVFSIELGRDGQMLMVTVPEPSSALVALIVFAMFVAGSRRCAHPQPVMPN